MICTIQLPPGWLSERTGPVYEMAASSQERLELAPTPGKDAARTMRKPHEGRGVMDLFSLRNVGLYLIFISVSAIILHQEVAGARPVAKRLQLAVGPQYGTTHVYVAPDDMDRFAASFLATFGGKSSEQSVATITPTPSIANWQALTTPVGVVSLLGFKTPIPYPFGLERMAYLVTNMDAAVRAAKKEGAAVLVAPFPDAIGRDVIVQWPGGVNMQFYWHTTAPSSPELQTIPESRVYVAPERATDFIRSFVDFAQSRVVSDNTT